MAGEMTIAQLFTEYVESRGINKSVLAKSVDLPYRSILRILNDENVPREDTARMIAETLRINESEWRMALVASHRARDLAKIAANPKESYLAFFRNTHGFIHPSGLSQHNADIRVPLNEIFVSLQAEADSERSRREEAAFRKALEDEGIDAKADSPDEEKKRGREGQRESLPSTPRVVELSAVVTGNAFAIILGAPGAGKTTLLKYLGTLHSEALEKGDAIVVDQDERTYGEALLPIYVRVAEYAEKGDRQPILDFIRASLKPLEASAGLALFNEHWREGRALILLDGLDEIAQPERRSEINREIENLAATCAATRSRLIVTSRIRGYHEAPLKDVPAFAIREMNREQVGIFFSHWCCAIEKAMGAASPEESGRRHSESILRAVNSYSGVRDLAVNPLLCTLIALIHRSEARLPERRAKLMEQAVKTLLRLWRPHQMRAGDDVRAHYEITPEEENFILRPLAYWLHREHSISAMPEKELILQVTEGLARMRGQAAGVQEGMEVLDFLTRVRNHSGILVERASGWYGFMHLLFEEYLAGLYLVDDTFLASERIRKLRYQPRWEEPIRLGIASKSVGDATSLIRSGILGQRRDIANGGWIPEEDSPVEQVLHRNVRIAARCLGDCAIVDSDLAGEVGSEIARLILYAWGDAYTSTFRENLIVSANGLWSHLPAAQTMREALLKALRHKNELIHQPAAQALSSVVSLDSTIREALLKMLRDEDGLIRKSVAQALSGAVSSDIVVREALLKMLEDKMRECRTAAVNALAGIASSDSIVRDALLKALRDEEWDVRLSAAQALSESVSSDSSVREMLLKMLKDEEWKIRALAARALSGTASSDNAVRKALLQAITDKDMPVRRSVVQALSGTISTDTMVRDALLGALMHEELDVRRSAIDALADVVSSDSTVREMLLTVLKDEEWSIRALGVEALSTAVSINCIVRDALLEALGDEEWEVRASAAQALSSVASCDSMVRDAFFKALNDRNSSVRVSAAQGLSSLVSSDSAVRDVLLNAIGDMDEEWHISCSAIQALSVVVSSDSTVRNALFKALEDEDGDVRWVAATALAQLDTLPEIQ